LALRGVHFVHSKETRGQTEPLKGEDIFLEKVIQLLELVDFEKSEIRRDSRYVFLCGGPIDSARGSPPSVREALLQHLPSRDRINDAHIILAERATEGLPGSNFTNLLDLEEYIAAVVDGVILIVESAGSICELGAFVKTPEISSKLIILISNTHDNISSFIKIGALKYFAELNDKEPEISPFHWDVGNGVVSVQPYVLDEMVKELSESVVRVRPKGRLRTMNLGDRIFITLALCHLLRGAKIGEIKSCYEAVGLLKYQDEIVKHLSVLEICNLVQPISHGKKAKYYLPNVQRLPLKIAFKPDVEDRDRDTLRWIREIAALVLQHEPARMKIFQEHQNAA
jgi:hypothetical protein